MDRFKKTKEYGAVLAVVLMQILPSLAFAANGPDRKPLWENLFVASFPIVIIVAVFLLIGKSLNKKALTLNERLLASNIEVAAQLKRIADYLEKKG